MNKTYTIVKTSNKADTVPEYLKNIPLAGVYAYYFNFHPHKETEIIQAIAEWFLNKRGWVWRED